MKLDSTLIFNLGFPTCLCYGELGGIFSWNLWNFVLFFWSVTRAVIVGIESAFLWPELL